jgi:hypothetical protein
LLKLIEVIVVEFDDLLRIDRGYAGLFVLPPGAALLLTALLCSAGLLLG